MDDVIKAMDDSIEEGFVGEIEDPKIIKVIGVGGGGGNTVSHMYNKGIHDVTFLLCNTDKQDLTKSPIPDKFKMVLGEGLGAGSDPQSALSAAKNSEADIIARLSDGTRMVFITAGMGGGTGTGAAPYIAQLAKGMGILTVAIVTIPFYFERIQKMVRALRGVEEISKNVDALLIIQNNNIFKVFDRAITRHEAFGKINDTLYIASKSIADIITFTGDQNIDFADVTTALKNSGIALISSGYGDGDTRVMDAIHDAIASQMINNSDLFKAKQLLLNIAHSQENDLTIGEMEEMSEFLNQFELDTMNTKWGDYIDNSLGTKVHITILASGFSLNVNHNDHTVDVVSDKEMAEENRLLEKYGVELGRKTQQAARFNPYILSKEELDHDQLIDLLEDHPAYNRDSRANREYKSQTKSKTPPPAPNVATTAARGRINTETQINF